MNLVVGHIATRSLALPVEHAKMFIAVEISRQDGGAVLEGKPAVTR